MKKIQIILAIFFLGTCLVGCEEEEKFPIPVATNIDTGAILRTIEIVSGGYDFLNISTAEWAVTVEEDDAENGGQLESVDVYVAFVDADNPAGNVEEELVKTIPASEFSTENSDLPRATIRVQALEALATLGLTEDDLAPADLFRFRLAVNLDDGSTYSSTNSGGNLTGRYFNSPFRYNASVGCPIEDDKFSGTYKVTAEGFSTDWAASGLPVVNFTESEFTADLETITKTVRRFNFTYLPELGAFAETMNIEFICDKAYVITRSTGLACVAGEPSLSFGTTDGGSEFDINNDESFIITLTDYIDGGGCGVSPYSVTLTFEKQ